MLIHVRDPYGRSSAKELLFDTSTGIIYVRSLVGNETPLLRVASAHGDAGEYSLTLYGEAAMSFWVQLMISLPSKSIIRSADFAGEPSPFDLAQAAWTKLREGTAFPEDPPLPGFCDGEPPCEES